MNFCVRGGTFKTVSELLKDHLWMRKRKNQLHWSGPSKDNSIFASKVKNQLFEVKKDFQDFEVCIGVVEGSSRDEKKKESIALERSK